MKGHILERKGGRKHFSFSRSTTPLYMRERSLIMFRHLLVPLDGSRHAEQALPVAARLARASQGTITLVQIFERAARSTPEAREKRIANGKSYLESVRQRPNLVQFVSHTVIIEENTTISDTPLRAYPPIDLIIVANQDNAHIKRWFMSSRAGNLTGPRPVPVLVLREPHPLHIHRRIDEMSYIRALVPLDGSGDSLAALVPAVQFVNAFSTPGLGEVHLAHIAVATAAESMADLETRLQAARQRLSEIGQQMGESLKNREEQDLFAPILTWAVTIEQNIAEGIVRRARHGEKHAETKPEHTYDVIVMATHDFVDQQKGTQGSITEQVLHITHLPLLIIRAEEVKGEIRLQPTQRAHGIAEGA
jgi:nucleotide-binding universal stress UspA family protein